MTREDVAPYCDRGLHWPLNSTPVRDQLQAGALMPRQWRRCSHCGLCFQIRPDSEMGRYLFKLDGAVALAAMATSVPA